MKKKAAKPTKQAPGRKEDTKPMPIKAAKASAKPEPKPQPIERRRADTTLRVVVSKGGAMKEREEREREAEETAAVSIGEQPEPGEHEHEWTPGVLPGDKRVKTCKVCGVIEEINRDEWEQLKYATAGGQRFAAPGRNT